MAPRGDSQDERAQTVPELPTEEDPAIVCVRGANGEIVCGPVVAEHEPAIEPAEPRGGASTKYCTICGAIYRKDYARCPGDGGAIVVADRDPQLGRRLGNYVIDELIGEGGMGRVYRAHHAHLADARYAIKVLLGDVAATASMRKRFAQEAQVASRLDHDNLVPVLDFGTAKGLLYIVMELVEGRVLSELVAGRPMAAREVVRMATAICEGLAYVHEAGLVHRDLKPDNVIVVSTTRGDIPRLTDFGLAITTEPADERLTSTGMAMGTPAYAPPEQIAGKLVDHRADLYALGASMFEMLTGGVLPWTGTVLEVATQKAQPAPPLPSKHVSVPPALDALVSDLLRPRASDRPASARAVIERLLLMTSQPSW